AVKKWVDRKKRMNEMSLSEELALWQRAQGEYKAGSEQREEIEENIYRVKKEMTDKINAINDDYLNKVKTLNQKLIDEEKKLNDEY
ncbi:hypothetical protein V4V35_26065, partial [Bacillus infantis]|uniref:hypothetical protein n=1 Tax=Bacillus infantis TaxID=324767 RepID=UPI002FBE3611